MDVKTTSHTGEEVYRTIHNLAYVPVFDKHLFSLNALAGKGLRYRGSINSKGFDVNEVDMLLNSTGKA